MGKWERVKLGNVSKVNPQKKQLLSLYENKEVSFIPMTDVTEDGRVYTNNVKAFSEVSSGFTYFLEDDVLFAKITPCMENGKGAIARGLKNGLGAGSTEFHVLRPNKELVTSDWIYRSISYSKFRKIAEINMTGSAGQKRVPKSFLENALIYLPPLETQKQIAKTLDTVAELLTMYKQQLAELDNLIKSIFYDMFGDPVANEKGWALKPIGDFSMVKIGPFGSLLHAEDYIEGGFPLVNPSHIIDGKIVPDMKLTLSTKKFKELKSYAMKKGDIVVGRRGEIGRCAIVDDEGFLCGTGSMYIRIKKDYLPMMLQRIISSETIRAKLEHQSVGVTMKNLNAGTISNLEIPMPPLPLQNQFVSIVTKIEEQKTLVKKAIDETQYLIDCLMSEYFE